MCDKNDWRTTKTSGFNKFLYNEQLQYDEYDQRRQEVKQPEYDDCIAVEHRIIWVKFQKSQKHINRRVIGFMRTNTFASNSFIASVVINRFAVGLVIDNKADNRLLRPVAVMGRMHAVSCRTNSSSTRPRT